MNNSNVNVNDDMLYDFILDDPYLELDYYKLVDSTHSKVMTYQGIRVKTQTNYENDLNRTVEFDVPINTEYDLKKSVLDLIEKAVRRYREYENIVFDLTDEQTESLINEIYDDIFTHITNRMYLYVEGIEA